MGWASPLFMKLAVTCIDLGRDPSWPGGKRSLAYRVRERLSRHSFMKRNRSVRMCRSGLRFKPVDQQNLEVTPSRRKWSLVNVMSHSGYYVEVANGGLLMRLTGK